VLAGFLGGTTGGMFGMGGPFLVMYLSKQLHKTAFRVTLSAIFLMNFFWRSSLYVYGGILGTEELMFALLMFPFLVAGVLMGSHLHDRVSQRTFNIGIGAVLIIAGVLLIAG